MDHLEALEANQNEHLTRVLECMVLANEVYMGAGFPAQTINDMRMSLSVYTKNVCGNWLVSAKKMAEKPEYKSKIGEISQQMTSLALTLSQVFIAPTLESKFKYNISTILIKYFKVIKNWCTKAKLLKNQQYFDELMNSVVELI